MKKITLLVFLISSIIIEGMAQDIHYSQFYASPLTLNPALTGVNDCNYRVGIMYRNQWKSVTTPYQTPSISFDINNVLQRVIKKGTLSAGALVLNDKAGDGDLSNLSVLGSIAYQRALTANRKLNISIGIQPGYVQKKLDVDKLTWESQFNGQTFDPTLSSNENFQKNKFGYFDLNAGLYLSYAVGTRSDIFLGGSVFHLIQPKESFLGTDNKLSMRYCVHGGVRIGVNDKLDIIPQVLFMMQSKAQEINAGLSLQYAFNTDVSLFVGGYDRLNDAIIAMAGLEFHKVRLGFSYDVNTSSLSDASNGKGGFEISLSYTGCLGGFILDKPIMFCPRY